MAGLLLLLWIWVGQLAGLCYLARPLADLCNQAELLDRHFNCLWSSWATGCILWPEGTTISVQQLDRVAGGFLRLSISGWMDQLLYSVERYCWDLSPSLGGIWGYFLWQQGMLIKLLGMAELVLTFFCWNSLSGGLLPSWVRGDTLAKSEAGPGS